jgi:DNA-binding CsgD family transcriptional regulator
MNEPLNKAALKYKLSKRETEAVGWLVQGLMAKEIGRKMNVTEGTVKQYLHNIYIKTESRGRADLTWKVLG